jgi:SSS family solute:Na+ symporter
MTIYDYAVLAFYFVFMLVISWVFRRFITNVSDYFRSGGQVLWWMAGGSAFMVSFSAWTFTGAASRAYGDGWPIMVIYLANAVGFFINAAYFGPKLRQLRVITSMEAVRQRFGRISEQTFTWITLPLQMLTAGIWLYGLGVFFAAAFSIDVELTIIVTGLSVIFISLVGGSWAVIASDFIQVLILMPVTAVATFLAVAHVGGWTPMMDQLATTSLNLEKVFTDDFLLFWCIAILFKQFLSTNNIADASRYLCVKDSHHARKAAMLGGVLFLGGIVIWFLPPMAATISHPNLSTTFPNLSQPSEGSFFAIAQATFPVGMVGLLVSGIFAATMSSMDSGLNKNAGVFIKNFYQPILRPGAAETELLKAGKITTLMLGFTVVSIALFYSSIQNLTLFELMVKFQILVSLPYIVPLVLGLIIKRTPGWAGWSTVGLCFLVSFLTDRFLNIEWAARKFEVVNGVTNWERQNWEQGIGVFTILGAGLIWFLFTKLFYRHETPAQKAAIEQFCTNLATPVNYAKEESSVATDDKQSWLIGWLCIPYGAVVTLMALIPNALPGRLAFVFCGGVVILVGWLLVKQSRRPAAVGTHS